MKKLALFYLLPFAVALGGCGSEPEPTPPRRVKAMRVLDASSLSTREFPGRADPGQEVNLSFRVGGPLVELPVSVGDRVEAGTLVARIDPTDYESAVKAVDGELQMAQAAARRAAADLGRIEATFRDDPGATSQTARDRARQLRDSAAASVRAAQATVDGARDQLGYTSLQAPFGGEVVETYVENFETVVPKQPIARIVDKSSIEFVISVPENLIGYAPNVTRVELSFDALAEVTVPAKIKEIGREASQATRTYPVTLVMSQPDGAEILPGMAGTARIEAELPEGARQLGIQIPATALFSEDDPEKSYVWVIDEATRTLKRRPVETGELSEFGVLIRAGLEGGEDIVVAGVSLLSEGQEVVPLDDESKDSGS
jgi:RND family efflux transporter MFP subunit